MVQSSAQGGKRERKGESEVERKGDAEDAGDGGVAANEDSGGEEEGLDPWICSDCDVAVSEIEEEQEEYLKELTWRYAVEMEGFLIVAMPSLSSFCTAGRCRCH